MNEYEGTSQEYDGMMYNLRRTFLGLSTSHERLQYIIWVQKQKELVESVSEDRAYEDFVKWAFGDLTPEETSLLNTEIEKEDSTKQ